jgi:hypothetical protein
MEFDEWHQMKIVKSIKNLWRDESGSAESTLVLIPLLILFLIGAQLTLAVHARNITRMETQNGASIRAISGEFEESDEFIHIESSGDSQNLDLLVAHGERDIRDLIPGFSGRVTSGRMVEVDGIAIVENAR